MGGGFDVDGDVLRWNRGCMLEYDVFDVVGL